MLDRPRCRWECPWQLAPAPAWAQGVVPIPRSHPGSPRGQVDRPEGLGSKPLEAPDGLRAPEHPGGKVLRGEVCISSRGAATSPQGQRSVCGLCPLPQASRPSLLPPPRFPLPHASRCSLGVSAAGPPSLQWGQVRLACTEAAPGAAPQGALQSPHCTPRLKGPPEFYPETQRPSVCTPRNPKPSRMAP